MYPSRFKVILQNLSLVNIRRALRLFQLKTIKITTKHLILCSSINETGSRSPCMRPSSDPPKMKNSTQTTLPHFNFSVRAELNDVTSRLIILINEEINEANCMVSNSAKLDRRTKQHTQSGVSTSDASRYMARKKNKKQK